MKTLRIRDWDKHFENSNSRKLRKLEWVPVPNRMDGAGYRELVAHENGASHLGVWLAVLEIASTCPVRGTLIRDEKTIGVRSISARSGLREEVIEESLERLISPEIGWLEYVEESVYPAASHDTADSSHNLPLAGRLQDKPVSTNEINDPPQSPTSRENVAASRARGELNRTEGNGRETNTQEDSATTPPKPGPIRIPDKSMNRPAAPSTGNQTLTPQRLTWMTNLLHSYMSASPTGIGPPRQVAKPPERVVLKCLEIVGLIDARDVEDFLTGRMRAGQRPGTGKGPQDYPWFVTVLRTKFTPQVAGVGV